MPVTDEMLMAYVDGELTPDERAEVEAVLARDPDRMAIVAMYQRTGDLAGSAYDHVLREPVPPHLIKAVMGAGAARPSTWRARLNPRSGPAMALAAGLAGLAIGLAVSIALQKPVRIEQGSRPVATAELGADGIPATGILAEALNRIVSGERLPGEGGSFIAPVVTFPRRGGGWCREYRVTGSGADGAAGIACRTQASEVWRIVAHHPWDGRRSDGSVVPLFGPGPRELDGIADKLQGGNPASVADEAGLIAGGWSGR